VVRGIVEASSVPVFNIEVDREHGYRVGESGVWAHNTCTVRVIGRQPDTAVLSNEPGYNVLNVPNWNFAINDAWVADGILSKDPFYMATPVQGNMVQTSSPFAGEETVYARELRQLTNAGYVRIGDYMVHLDNVATWHPP
jgi:hypothetical protein